MTFILRGLYKEVIFLDLPFTFYFLLILYKVRIKNLFLTTIDRHYHLLSHHNSLKLSHKSLKTASKIIKKNIFHFTLSINMLPTNCSAFAFPKFLYLFLLSNRFLCYYMNYDVRSFCFIAKLLLCFVYLLCFVFAAHTHTLFPCRHIFYLL